MIESAKPIPTPVADKPPRTRRWIPLSLRAYAVLLLMLGGGGTVWFGLHAYRQYAAIERLERAVFNKRTGIHMQPGKVVTSSSAPGWLRSQIGDTPVRAFERPISVQLYGPEFDDADMARRSVFPELESLTL